MLGDEGQGWAVAMDLLPYERSTALWVRVAFLQRRLDELVAMVEPGGVSDEVVGEVHQQLVTLRARSRATQYRMASGDKLGPETSVDKILLATTEQAIFDLARDGLDAAIVVGDEPGEARWRAEYLYSRAASIYGGSSEIQRNIVARRLLDLGSDR
ncbi:MAG: acyl-CoA dehydrogenase family protein, partial [Acidimicrobiia bacterium]|nr:acyl-CoA dehydrogenase family protein [Acidimicrobiia bacterium]